MIGRPSVLHEGRRDGRRAEIKASGDQDERSSLTCWSRRLTMDRLGDRTGGYTVNHYKSVLIDRRILENKLTE